MSAVYLIADEKEVNALRDRDFYAGVCGSGTVVLNVGNKMAATIGASTVTISDGVCVDEGGRIQIDYGDTEEFTIPTGTTGVDTTYYIGFLVGTDGSCEQFVSTSKPTETSVRSGASSKYVTLYSVRQTGTSISSVTALFAEEMNMDDIRKAMEWHDERATYDSNYFTEIGTPRCIYNSKVVFVHICLYTKQKVPAKTAILTITPKDNSVMGYGANTTSKGTDNIGTTLYANNGKIYTALEIPSGRYIDCDYVFLRS